MPEDDIHSVLARIGVRIPHPGFSENWLLAPELTIEEIIWLWCDWEPGLVGKDKDVVAVVDERLKLLPASKPIQAMLWAALWSGELPCLHSGHIQFPWVLFSEREQKNTYWPHIVFSRDEVKEFATKKGYRPKFLFPEDGQPVKPSTAGGDAQRKSGRGLTKKDVAIREMIVLVEAEIKRGLTKNTAIKFFRKRPPDIHNNFTAPYLIEDQSTLLIAWTDAEGDRLTVAPSSLGRYRTALKRERSRLQPKVTSTPT